MGMEPMVDDYYEGGVIAVMRLMGLTAPCEA